MLIIHILKITLLPLLLKFHSLFSSITLGYFVQMPATSLPVACILLLLANLASADGVCDQRSRLDPRPHSLSIVEFGAVGDGKTLNTVAFQNAIFYLKSFADKGGAQLYVPAGKWLTGSINLTSHLTFFLEKGATIIGSEDPAHWGAVDPLPSYGRGIELPGRRYRSLINGENLHDVVVTGDNGTIDGQGSIWWDWYTSGSLNLSRPHLIEFINCDDVFITNLTLVNAPSYGIHPVYCSNVFIQNVTITAPSDSPRTVGVVPDSSNNLCVEESTIDVGFDAVSLKSGWDEYGLSYGRPTKNVHLRRLILKAHSGASVSFGSEMSGGISDVVAEELRISSSKNGVEFRTARGRGAYMNKILVSAVEMDSVDVALKATGLCDTHPDMDFDPDALPVVDRITLDRIVGSNVSTAGIFAGVKDSPFTSICMFNVTLSPSTATWLCSDVVGYSESTWPPPCEDLLAGNYSSCYYNEDRTGVASL